MKYRTYFFSLFFITSLASARQNDCESWFHKSGLKPGNECMIRCSALPTGMDTFLCPKQCVQLCDNRSFIEKLLGNIAYYPGLTAKERELIVMHPTESLKVFQKKQKAEDATFKRFGRDTNDDESDAFRHFVWAALVAKEIGPELAKDFLDAHEMNGKDAPGKAMDLANNRAGLLVSEQLRKEGRLTDTEIESECIKAMKDHTLIILKPKGDIK